MANTYSVLPSGSGAHVVHACLADSFNTYTLHTVPPWRTLVPAMLGKCSPPANTSLLHFPADYAAWGKPTGLPIVATIHNYVCDKDAGDWSSPSRRLYYRALLRADVRSGLMAANTRVAVSHYLAGLVNSEVSGVGEIRVIYNGVNEERFSPARVDRKKMKFRILFCGNLSQRKRAHLLPHLSKALGKEFEILYTGKSRFKPVSGGASLTALGTVSPKYMPAIFQSMDALFMPSAREGFGLCVAEAMACGLPVVAANASAMPELVTSQGGFLCELDNLEAYTQAFKHLLDDSSLKQHMGEYNRIRVEEKFTLQRMLDEYQLLFEQVLDEAAS